MSDMAPRTGEGGEAASSSAPAGSPSFFAFDRNYAEDFSAPTPPHVEAAPARRRGIYGVLLITLAISVLAASFFYWDSTRAARGTASESLLYPAATLTPLPKPKPTASPTADPVALSAGNPLHTVTYPLDDGCKVAPTYVDAAGAVGFMEQLTTCLTVGWQKQLKARGMSARDASFKHYTTASITTKCGEAAKELPFFCPADRTVYVPQAFAVHVMSTNPAMAVAAIAHEVTHYAQFESGIMGAAITREGREQGLKRVELQALCSQYAAIMFTPGFARYRGDLMRLEFLETEQHGTTASMQYWLDQGMASAKFASCNTYVAPLERVQ